MSHSILEIIEKHARYIRLNQPEKLELAEHCIFKKHQPLLESTTVVSSTQKFWERVILVYFNIQLEPLSVNREIGVILSNYLETSFRAACC